MFLQPNSATDSVIGTRTLTDEDADITLIDVAAKTLKQWLQGIRNNLKALFGHTHTGEDGTNKVSFNDLTDVPNIGDATELADRVQALEDVLYYPLTDNLYAYDLTTLGGLTIESGAWNQTGGRLEC
jgi:hypothetical protein